MTPSKNEEGTHKIPTAMIPHIASFFLAVICSLMMRGKGITRMMKSFSMLRIPAARKNWLTLIQSP